MKEHASASGPVSPEVIGDLRAIQQASARGELRAFRYVRVLRDAEGRRVVVSADSPTSAPRLPAARSIADRARRLKDLEHQIHLAKIKAELDRGQHLEQLEREVAQARALRTGAATHFGVEMYVSGPYRGPLIKFAR